MPRVLKFLEIWKTSDLIYLPQLAFRWWEEHLARSTGALRDFPSEKCRNFYSNTNEIVLQEVLTKYKSVGWNNDQRIVVSIFLFSSLFYTFLILSFERYQDTWTNCVKKRRGFRNFWVGLSAEKKLSAVFGILGFFENSIKWAKVKEFPFQDTSKDKKPSFNSLMVKNEAKIYGELRIHDLGNVYSYKILVPLMTVKILKPGSNSMIFLPNTLTQVKKERFSCYWRNSCFFLRGKWTSKT